MDVVLSIIYIFGALLGAIALIVSFFNEGSEKIETIKVSFLSFIVSGLTASALYAMFEVKAPVIIKLHDKTSSIVASETPEQKVINYQKECTVNLSQYYPYFWGDYEESLFFDKPCTELDDKDKVYIRTIFKSLKGDEKEWIF